MREREEWGAILAPNLTLARVAIILKEQKKINDTIKYKNRFFHLVH